MRNSLILWLFIGILGGLAAAEAKPSPNSSAPTCEAALPTPIRQVIRAKMVHWKVVSLADLIPDDQEAWKKRFGDQCPGVAVGRFTNHDQSYAVTLIRGKDKFRYQTLVVIAKASSGNYRIITLSPIQRVDVVSTVSKLPPGGYSSADDSIHVRCDYEVISYEVNEAGAILYYWDRNRYRALQTSE